MGGAQKLVRVVLRVAGVILLLSRFYGLAAKAMSEVDLEAGHANLDRGGAFMKEPRLFLSPPASGRGTVGPILHHSFPIQKLCIKTIHEPTLIPPHHFR